MNAQPSDTRLHSPISPKDHVIETIRVRTPTVQDSNISTYPLRSSSSIDSHSPFSQLAQDEESPDPNAKHRSLTFLNGLALVLGLQIGSGIFYAPSQVANHVPSPGAATLVWLIAGLLVWTGAASFVELGVAVPKNGGVQEYLRVCYGEFFGFLFAWIWIVVAKPCSMAMISMIFAENVAMVWGAGAGFEGWVLKVLAVGGLFMITAVNCAGTTTGAKVANGFLGLKLCIVISIVFIGLGLRFLHMGEDLPDMQSSWFGEDPDPQRRTLSDWAEAGEYATAAYGALFCYGGWEAVSLLHNC